MFILVSGKFCQIVNYEGALQRKDIGLGLETIFPNETVYTGV